MTVQDGDDWSRSPAAPSMPNCRIGEIRVGKGDEFLEAEGARRRALAAARAGDRRRG